MPPCRELNCRHLAYCGENGKLLTCIDHKEDNYINYFDQKCENCNLYVTHGFKGKIPTHCEFHKLNKQIEFGSSRCRKCVSSASYGYLKDKKRLFCAKHRDKNEHVDVMHKFCEKCGNARACYGDPVKRQSLVCGNLDCREPHYVNLTAKKCEEFGCTVDASYGDPNGKSWTHCKKHGEPLGYAAVKNKNKKCNICCKTTKSYGLESDGIALYCSKCARTVEGDFVDVLYKKCHCGIRATYGDSQTGKQTHCATHGIEIGYIDLAHTQCNYDIKKCDRRPTLGFPGSTLTRCNYHSLPGQLRKPNAKCACGERAIYGTKDQPLHCETCKQEGEIDLVYKNCNSCGLPDILNKDNLCEFCDPEVVKVRRLLKQKEVKDYIDMFLPSERLYFSYDTIIDIRLGKERPDFMFECGTYRICLEVDEYQHKRHNYECICEQTRMLNIFNTNQKKTLFIRYNPDNYKLVKGRRTKPLEGIKRRENLVKMIQYWQEHEPEFYCSVIYMYFDEDDPKNWKIPINLHI